MILSNLDGVANFENNIVIVDAPEKAVEHCVDFGGVYLAAHAWDANATIASIYHK